MRKVDGWGKKPCEFLVCGEGPGFDEDRTGRPFSGRSGQELDRFLDGVDLPTRDEMFLTNIYRYHGGKDYRYTAADLERDEPDLIRELQEVMPKIIVTLGRPAARYFLGDVDLDSVEGLPWYLPDTCYAYPCAPESVVVFPVFHPAAGLHNSELSPYVVRGFKEFARFLEGETTPRVLFQDPIPNPVYELLEGDDVCRVLHGL